MDEEVGMDTMIDIEDEYSYTAENAGLGLTFAMTDDVDDGTPYSAISGMRLFRAGSEGCDTGASNS